MLSLDLVPILGRSNSCSVSWLLMGPYQQTNGSLGIPKFEEMKV